MVPRGRVRLAAVIATPGSNSPEIQAQHRRRQAGRLRAHGSSVAAATVAALFLALPSLAFLPPRQAPHFGPEIRSLRQDTIVAWQPDPAADYYLFEMSLGGRQVKVEPVRGSSVTLGASLAPGLYAWRVFAGRGPMANHETQGPIAGGTVALE